MMMVILNIMIKLLLMIMMPFIVTIIEAVESESPVLRTGVYLKKWGCYWVTYRSGWLLELLTELKNGHYTAHRAVVRSVSSCKTVAFGTGDHDARLGHSVDSSG